MKIDTIIKNVNTLLAGEMLRYRDLEIHLDRVIDEINSDLQSTYPVISEFIASDEAGMDANYNLFPDKYIRSVVIPGVAYYYYQMDEEGEQAANGFLATYRANLFKMVRDYIIHVPEKYQANDEGYVEFSQEIFGGIGIDITKGCKL